VLVDVDSNYNPDWVWSTFDHLDVNRHPMQFPDWTHGNALLYSPDDHDLLFSMRHQNWIVKIDFQDGTGTGNILWHLGYQGDFTLVGDTNPADWFYAQHGMNFFSQNTSGVFQLGTFDNGNDRQFAAGVTCGAAGAPPCLYSTVPVLQLDETAMTATMISHYIAPASMYSFFGGQADLLPNGDYEADFCSASGGAIVQEYQPGTSVVQTAPQIVWQSVSPGFDQYRALRIPSLYPGVQW
jgi:arylsulfate sulfotransferase